MTEKGVVSLKENKVFRAVFSVTGVILVSKLMGFVKQMITASTFGATIETDLISLSQNFIGDIQYVLVQTLLTAFVAVYVHLREEDELRAKELAVAVGKAFSIIAAGIVVLVELLAPAVSRVIAPTYAPELSARLAGYLRLFAPALFLFVWIAVFHALLDGNKRFVPGQLEGLNQSVILIALIFLLEPHLGIKTLVVAYFAYTGWNALFLCRMSRKYWSYSQGNPFRNAAVQQLLRMVGPLLLGYSMVYINQQVAKILSSGLPAGTVTAMDYAAVLSNLVGTFVGAFCSVLFSYITTHISRGAHESAAELSIKSGVLMIMAFLPVSILTVLLAKDVVMIVFGRGAFGTESVAAAAAALQGYAFMFVPLVLRDLFSRFQYGYQNSKTPMVNSTIGIVANIVVSVLLCPAFGVFGITVASSVSVLICGILNAVTARRHNTYLSFAPLFRQIPWMCASGIGCGAAAIWCRRMLAGSSSLVRFVCAVLCGGGVYLLLVLPVLFKLLREMRKKAQ